MKVLWLTNSSDAHPGVPEDQRSPAVAARTIEAATGQPASVVVKSMWPTPRFPDVLGRWLEEHSPDVVFIRLSAFWVAYESVPLRLRRRLGRLGEPLAAAGLKIGDRPWLTENPAYKSARTLVVRSVGGDTHFTPDEVEAVFDETLRRVAAKESIIPVVRGTSLLLNSAGTRAGLRRARRRVVELNDRVQASCPRYQVAFFPEPPGESLSTTRLRDDLHDSQSAHQKLGEDDAAAIITAWRGATSPV